MIPEKESSLKEKKESLPKEKEEKENLNLEENLSIFYEK